jgi:hypothetical protein
MAAATPDGDVDMTVRCNPPLARVIRTAAAACAAVEGFSIDEVEDLRLLVDEAYVALCASGSGAVRLRLELFPGHMLVDLCGDGPAGPVDLSALRTLAAVLTAEFRIDFDALPPRFAATFRAAS